MPADIDWAMLVAYHRGCDAVRVEAEVNISYLERLFIKEIAEENRAKGISLANDICKNGDEYRPRFVLLLLVLRYA